MFTAGAEPNVGFNRFGGNFWPTDEIASMPVFDNLVLRMLSFIVIYRDIASHRLSLNQRVGNFNHKIIHPRVYSLANSH